MSTAMMTPLAAADTITGMLSAARSRTIPAAANNVSTEATTAGRLDATSAAKTPPIVASLACAPAVSSARAGDRSPPRPPPRAYR